MVRIGGWNINRPTSPAPSGNLSGMKRGFVVISMVLVLPHLGAVAAETLDLPNQNALTSWRDLPGYTSEPTDLSKIEAVQIRCADQNLMPTHPAQTGKLYHLFRSNRYDHMKLSAEDYACRIGLPKVRAGVPARCGRADTAYDVIISDLYQDSCGNFYRGFIRRQYVQRDETVATLFSAGRMVYQNPRSSIPNDMITGKPYAVPVNEFVLISGLLEGDQEIIARAKVSD